MLLFIYTPFYSKSILFLLNQMVPVEVNHVAAQSQQMAALSENDDLEPGSDLWIARQAYLKVLQDAAKREDAQSLKLIEQRYHELEVDIKKSEHHEQVHQENDDVASDLSENASEIKNAVHLNTVPANQTVLMEKYIQFLIKKPVAKHEQSKEISHQISEDLKQVKEQEEKKNSDEPSAIVVLGGGLTAGKNRKEIVVNSYTRLRLEKTLEIEKENKLPILLSGVEAPYMQAWLQKYGVDAKLLENRSMNTCENSRFSSLLLQKKGGAPKVILITDEYHMPRTRRLFAMNGISTIPVSAPIPTPLTQWQPALQNYDHSRRANYEFLASVRDILFGTSDCREVP